MSLSLAHFAAVVAISTMTHGIDEPARMEAVILRAIPIGTEFTTALRFMRGQGFFCSYKRGAGSSGGDVLHCMSEDGRNRIDYRRWWVTIDNRRNKVTEVRAATGIVGL